MQFMLYIYRRLHVSKAPIPEDLLNSVIALIGRSIEAARSSMAAGLPWYHVAKIPFQALFNDTYQTGATWEAVTAAYALVQLHRKRREAEVQKLSELLNLYPIMAHLGDNGADPMENFAWLDTCWYNEFLADANLGISLGATTGGRIKYIMNPV
ncbi:hypothetical protein LTS12_027253 [Elasticomyces elasticus]|nr:hypothetical protein LTS12_027253 [Elasticomyces elasticus]